MRIVAGSLRGRAIASPRHEGLRPTSDRVREAVFNILLHGNMEFRIEGCKVLDLFAGTGALGLEALSRGAAFCLFVEDDAHARGLIRSNVESFSLAGVTKIFRRDATDLGPAGKHDSFGLVFADPPYGKGLGERALASAGAGGWLAPGAIAVLEERAGAGVQLPTAFMEFDRRQWGDTEVCFARYNSAAGAPSA